VEETKDWPGDISARVRPNPAHGQVFVEVILPAEQRLVFEVFNPAGQRVKHIDMGVLRSGHHRVPVFAGDMNPGVYFYTLKAGDKTLRGRFVLR